MNATKRLAVLCLVVASAAPGPMSPRAGKVLILDNERAVEGDITLQGEQYCVRRGKGEMSVPRSKALRLCASWEDALGFMKSRANLHDPDERLRLARWCEQHALVEQALREVKAALEMRPAHQGARQLQAFLEKTLALPQKPAPETAPRTGQGLMPVLDIGSESLALFNSKVHAILMNTCLQCHAQGRGGNFQLSRGYDGSQRAVMQRNLAAVIAQIDAKQPLLSPLLIKAASAHGKSDQPPLQGGRKSIPYKTLETWVQGVVSNNPHLRELYVQAPAENATTSPSIGAEPRLLPASVAAPLGEEKPPQPREVGRFASPPSVSLPGPADAARVVPVNVQTPMPPPAAQRTPVTTPASTPAPVRVSPADPFDPAVFNQQLRRE